MILTITELSR